MRLFLFSSVDMKAPLQQQQKKELPVANAEAEATVFTDAQVASHVFDMHMAPRGQLAAAEKKYVDVITAYGSGRGIQSAVVMGNTTPEGTCIKKTRSVLFLTPFRM